MNHRGTERTEKTSEADAFDPIDEALDVEIDEEAPLQPRQLQVREQLRSVDRKQRLDDLELHNDFAPDQQVNRKSSSFFPLYRTGTAYWHATVTRRNCSSCARAFS